MHVIPTIESWAVNPLEQGPLYPFAGIEVLLFLVSVALWLAWTVWQFRNEGATIEKESQQLTGSMLGQMLDREAGRLDRHLHR